MAKRRKLHVVVRKREVAAAIAHAKRLARNLAYQLSGISNNELAANVQIASDGFLKSLEWKALAKSVVKRYGWQCMKCKRTPKVRSSVNVDHIKPRRFYPALAMSFNNLQVLCNPCNKAKGNKHETDYRPPLPTLGATQQSELDELALYLIDCDTNETHIPAISRWYDPDTWAADSVVANDERLYVWGCLKQQSQLRAAINANKPTP